MTQRDATKRNEKLISDYLKLTGGETTRSDRAAAVKLLSEQYRLHPSRVNALLRRSLGRSKRWSRRHSRRTPATPATMTPTMPTGGPDSGLMKWLDHMETRLVKELEAVRVLRRAHSPWSRKPGEA